MKANVSGWATCLRRRAAPEARNEYRCDYHLGVMRDKEPDRNLGFVDAADEEGNIWFIGMTVHPGTDKQGLELSVLVDAVQADITQPPDLVLGDELRPAAYSSLQIRRSAKKP
jgi:hypothetical protein